MPNMISRHMMGRTCSILEARILKITHDNRCEPSIHLKNCFLQSFLLVVHNAVELHWTAKDSRSFMVSTLR